MTAAGTAAAPRRRAVAGWTAIGAALLVVGAVAAAIGGIAQMPAAGLLDPQSATPDGGRALARILEGHGVAVTVARDRAAAEDAVTSASTLVLTDTAPLSDEALAAVTGTAADVVLLEPRSRDLRLLLARSAPAGVGDGAAPPGCGLAEAVRAGEVSPGTVFRAVGDAVGCYPSGDGHGLLVLETGDRRIAALDATALLTNERLARDGNAALGVNLLGRRSHVVWYLPALQDSDLATAPTVGELTPDWVTPAIALLAGAALAAAVWRGRRFGPLVAETLPVSVRAGETTVGRAQLYARAGDAGHAADQLRIAALDRLARLVGLGPAASAREVSDAVAVHLSADPGTVAGVLLDAVPRTDRELVDLAARLRDLEDALASKSDAIVTGTLRPERNTP
ncbi:MULTISPECIES: DUF4350 domain-containing protein [Microbacterium]|uniref:DUF4350 domain-containing protein n=1 Tax=Microbacterium saccharophilum TaxID=1213358 RepID=A0A7Z7D3F8_9MICO|nr:MULTISPECIES: DUF4350 domain-containing protein [Microbacterium]SFI63835.1 hypothetical protein SAMN04487751_2427 [Microbacterium saccharophilum]